MAKKKALKKLNSKKTDSKKKASHKDVQKKKSSTAKKKSTRTIAVDFDGVIHLYSKGFQDGTIYDKPVPGVRDAMQQMKAKGFKLYIFSTRSNKIFHKKDSIDQNKAMEAYLNKHNIPFDRIWSFGKPMADIYIDDRAIGFRGDWQTTLEEVESFQPWNAS